MSAQKKKTKKKGNGKKVLCCNIDIELLNIFFRFFPESKKRKKKKPKPAKEDDNIVSFSPLTFYIDRAHA